MVEVMTYNFKRIGKYCRYYRMHILEMTLKEIEGSEDIKALSSFEHGRSTNIKHLLKYVKACKTHQQKINFLQGLITTIEGD